MLDLLTYYTMNLKADWKTVLDLLAGFCVKLIMFEFCMYINTMNILNKSCDFKIPICIVLLTGISGVWKYHARLVPPGRISFRTS